MDTISFLGGLCLGTAACGTIAWVLLRNLARSERTRAEATSVAGMTALAERQRAAEERVAALSAERDRLLSEAGSARERAAAAVAELEAERRSADDKLKALAESEQRLTAQFKALAGEALAQANASVAESGKVRLEALLTPFREQIARFEKTVAESYEKGARDHSALRNELKNLTELNQRMSREADTLSKALRGQRQTMGAWGELVLTTLLERSGLEAGREYEVQRSVSGDEGGRLRPDVVVRLPEGRLLVIDSKVSLQAWLAHVEAVDEAAQDAAADALVASLRAHLRDLAGKEYQQAVGGEALDFVLMFVPIEAAFTLALRRDPTLFQDAFDRNVVVVTPTTLLATLRTVGGLWRIDRQNRNAQQIAERAGRLYDKFLGFAGDLREVGERLAQAQTAHDQALAKLSSGSGNLVGQVEKLRKLGARTAKRLDADLLARGGDGDDED